MAGATREHNLIVANIVGEARNALKDRPCEVYSSDLRVLIIPSGLYTYPDITIVCGEPQLEDEVLDTLLNPTVLFEVGAVSNSKMTKGNNGRCWPRSLFAPRTERNVRGANNDHQRPTFNQFRQVFEPALPLPIRTVNFPSLTSTVAVCSKN